MDFYPLKNEDPIGNVDKLLAMPADRKRSQLMHRLKVSREVKGFIYIFINALLLAVTGILFEFSRLSGTQMALSTSVVGTSLGVAMFAIGNKRPSVLNKRYGWALLNGPVFGGGVIFFLYSSMDKIGPASTTVVQIFTSIVSALVIEKFKLKKAPHWLSIVAVGVGFSGMMCLCQSSDSVHSLHSLNLDNVLGVLFGFIAGLFCVSFFSFIKAMSRDIPDSWHWIAYMLGCAAPCLPMLYCNVELPSCHLREQSLALLSALSQSICGLMAVKGFLLIKASAAFIFQLMASVLAFLLQLVFLPHLVRLFSCIGALLIVCAITLQFIVITKLERKPTTDHEKKFDEIHL